MDMQRSAPPHGGDREAFRQAYGQAILDFSVNTNPYGLSPVAREAAIAALDRADRYPDPHCRALTGALARKNGVAECQVVVGNGASDVIFRLARVIAPARALVCAPTFSEYERACAQLPCTVVPYYLKEERNFCLDEDFLDAIPGMDLVFLCEPNNPTGAVDDPQLLARIVRRCGQEGAVLAVDECFNGFLANPTAASIRPLLAQNPHLVVIDALTKTQGMAGLRLGYALCSDAALVTRLREAGVPWSVSVIAQEAGCAALEDDAHLAKARTCVNEQRPLLSDALKQRGFRVYPSQANYLLARSPIPCLCERMAQRGVMVRDCATFDGLPPECVRFAVRLPHENRQLLQVLDSVLADAGKDAR